MIYVSFPFAFVCLLYVFVYIPYGVFPYISISYSIHRIFTPCGP